MTERPTTLNRAWVVLTVALVVVGAATLSGFLWFALTYRSFSQQSNSMYPTVREGDVVLAARGKAVAVGDVVVFRSEADGPLWVKRIVAGGGDEVQMKRGRLFVNDRPIPWSDGGAAEDGMCWNGSAGRRVRETNGRRYVTLDCGPDGELDDTPIYVVPEGFYFMMGDHRDNSVDSRTELGLIRREAIFGPAERIVLARGEGRPGGWFAPVQ